MPFQLSQDSMDDQNNPQSSSSEDASTAYYYSQADPMPLTSTNTSAIPPSNSPRANTSVLSRVIKALVILSLVAVAIAFVLFLKDTFTVKPLDAYTKNLSVETLQNDLHISLSLDDTMAKKLPIWDSGSNTFTVVSGDKIGLIYKNGTQPVGLTFTSKQYSLYGISVGDSESHIYKASTFPTDNSFEVLNDYQSGNSVATYFCDSQNNTCLVVQINQASHRIASITYFNDINIVTNGLDFN